MAIRDLYLLWSALDEAVMGEVRCMGRLTFPATMPWVSSDLAVASAWAALTMPENLKDLEEWGREPDKMNAFAKQCTGEALRVCRENAQRRSS